MSELPAASSVIGNLPERNSAFVGRGQLLGELQLRLTKGDRVQVLHGLGGTGKTQTALEYAHRYLGRYGLVWWISAETESSVLLDYTRLAERLGEQVPPEATPREARDQIDGLLQGRAALLVFDAAPDAATLANLLPSARSVHVLITSRNPNWPSPAHTRPVPLLERTEAVELLRRASGVDHALPAAERLAVALGDLPLALEQAAAVMRLRHLGYAEYLALFETQWASMLGEGLRPVDYPRTVAMTWGLAFQAVDQANPGAGDLLRFAAFLSSGHVPMALLLDGAAQLPPSLARLASDQAAWGAALATLGSYSLIESHAQPGRSTPTAFAVHRLVASVTRDRMSDAEQAEWCAVAIRLLSAVFHFDSGVVAGWSRCAGILPHVIDATLIAERLNVLPRQTVELLNHAGRYLLKRAQYADARSLLERAMSLCERDGGEQHPLRSTVFNNLGRAYEHLGDTDTAVHYFEQALALDTAALGHAHPHVAEVVNNYGICMQKRGDRDMAKRQFQWAAEIYEAHYGPQHPKLAQILNNLGYALKSLNDHANAQVQLQRSLTIAEMTVGPDHPTTARILYNLADVLRHNGQLSAAAAHLERALSIDDAALSPTHPDVAADCLALAEVMTGLQRAVEAAEYHARAARIRGARSTGPRTPIDLAASTV